VNSKEVVLSKIILATALSAAMAGVLVKYLFDTFSQTTLIVAFPTVILVVATALVPYWIQRRRCAREARRGTST